MESIFHQLIIESDVQSVYKAVSEQEGLSKWWIADCTVKPEIGFINHFRLDHYVDNKMKVINLEPHKLVIWECIEGEVEWIGTLVTFELEEFKGNTKLSFKHSNWAGQTEFYASCNFHWARHLTMLKEYCESQIDQIDYKRELSEVKKLK